MDKYDQKWTHKRDGAGVPGPVLSDGNFNDTPGTSARNTSAGLTNYSHAGIKNGTRQTDTAQTVSASKQYDAFGNETSSSGTWAGIHKYGGPFGYQQDTDSGLKLLGHRYYDPSIGRFITRDPTADGRNWYTYCRNAPVSGSDPTGFQMGKGGNQNWRDSEFESWDDKKVADELEATKKAIEKLKREKKPYDKEEKRRQRLIREQKARGERRSGKQKDSNFSGQSPSRGYGGVPVIPLKDPWNPFPGDPRCHPDGRGTYVPSTFPPFEQFPIVVGGALSLIIIVLAPEVAVPVIVGGGAGVGRTVLSGGY